MSSPTGQSYQHLIAILFIVGLGLFICSQRIGVSHGFLTDDCTHLEYSYQRGLQTSAYEYLPGVTAHRPIGRDAITFLLKHFAEDETSIIWTLLLLHIVNSLLVWLSIYRLINNWWAALAGAAFFLFNISVYQTVYVPAVIFDLLSTFFISCSLLLVSLALRSTARYHLWLLLCQIPFLIAAVKTKESALVSVIPLFLLNLTGQNQTVQHKSVYCTVKNIIQRLSKPKSWEVIWFSLNILTVLVLILTVASDSKGVTETTHPYYSEYSFRTLGRSFGFFIATLFFNAANPTPMRPPAAFIIFFFALLASLLFRNRWMVLGFVWFIVFLLPLAALKNHYALAYYPYPANIGTALFIAGVFETFSKIWSKFKKLGFMRYALPLIFIACISQQSFQWIKQNALFDWYDGVHARREKFISALKTALPQPPPFTSVILIEPETIHLDKNMSSLIKVVYKDMTLICHQFNNEQEAEKFLSDCPSNNLIVVLKKEGDSYEVRKFAQ